MSILPDLSIILPALHPKDDFIRCIYSVRAALKNNLQYEIIVVAPDITSFNDFDGDDDLQICIEDRSGIYGAMNVGIKKAKGNYLYFIGQDDILLPAAVEAIMQGKETEADLVLADVFWGKDRIFKNPLSRKYLAWRNWCHQGIFYNRLRFIEEIGEYPLQFKAQADHYVNIVFSSVPKLKLTRYYGCVAWYSAYGFSACSPDLSFRLAFPAVVRKHIGFFSYLCVIFRRSLLSVWKIYQER